MTAVSATDVWAVGYYFNNGYQTLTEHWNGTAWSIIASPNSLAVGDQPQGSIGSQLNSVSARASNDIWAVGVVVGNSDTQTLTEHWNGTAWSVVASVNPSVNQNTLNGVAVVTTNDVWAVGTTLGSSTYQTLIERYNDPCTTPTATATATGTRTSTTTVTRTATPTGLPASATATATGGANTATVTRTATVPAGTATVTQTGVPASSTATGVSSTATPTSISSTATQTLVAATGTATAGSSTATGTVLPTTPTVRPTTSVTGTPLAASATPTRLAATATPCAIQFSDVQDATAYYYQGVYYLACRGVLSGYSDGTFKPFNNTTRGQMTKIVTLAFAIPLVTPTTATFADVDGGNVFYQLIETAAARGIVSGYSCGGVNPQTGAAEPCDGARRPYFRPSNFVTRGQLAKIVVIGAGWAVQSPATPTFSDVPTDNVFYGFIETAVCHGAVGGYSDGTFRPNNFAFRGQIAKIVYLAVTNPPACP